MMGAPTNVFGGKFRQLAYVTNDFDQALDTFARTAGVERFLQLRDYEVMVGPDRTVPCHIALALSGGVEIEVIEPRRGVQSVYTEGLAGADFALRFHHVAYTLPSLDALIALKGTLRSRGLQIALEGRADGLDYFYGDLRTPFGHYVEFVYGTPEYEAGIAAAMPVN